VFALRGSGQVSNAKTTLTEAFYFVNLSCLSSRNIVVSSPSTTSINTGIYKVLKVAIMSLSAKEQVLVNEMMYTN